MKKIFVIALILLVNLGLAPIASAQDDTPVTPAPVEESAQPSGSGSENLSGENRIQGRTGPADIYTGNFFRANESERYTLNGVIEVLLPGVARWIAGFLAALAVIFLIYAGVLFLTAGGEEEKISEATKTAFYVLVGVVLTMFAYVIVYLFLTLFNPS
jgi:hypothetical protein